MGGPAKQQAFLLRVVRPTPLPFVPVVMGTRNRSCPDETVFLCQKVAIDSWNRTLMLTCLQT